MYESATCSSFGTCANCLWEVKRLSRPAFTHLHAGLTCTIGQSLCLNLGENLAHSRICRQQPVRFLTRFTDSLNKICLVDMHAPDNRQPYYEGFHNRMTTVRCASTTHMGMGTAPSFMRSMTHHVQKIPCVARKPEWISWGDLKLGKRKACPKIAVRDSTGSRTWDADKRIPRAPLSMHRETDLCTLACGLISTVTSCRLVYLSRSHL
jgi:hypothetical protein